MDNQTVMFVVKCIVVEQNMKLVQLYKKSQICEILCVYTFVFCLKASVTNLQLLSNIQLHQTNMFWLSVVWFGIV